MLILCAGGIRYPLRDKPGDMPRALLQLNGETIVQRLIRQVALVGAHPIVAVGCVGRGGWEQWHVDEFSKLGCDLVISERMRPSYLMGTTIVLLEAVQRHGVQAGSKIMLLPGDFVFTDAAFRRVWGYPAPCYYCENNTDPGVIVDGRSLPAFLALVHRYENFTWNRVWFEYAGLWKKERGWFRKHGFKYFGKLRGDPKNDPDRFVEVDVADDYLLAKELVKRHG